MFIELTNKNANGLTTVRLFSNKKKMNDISSSSSSSASMMNSKRRGIKHLDFESSSVDSYSTFVNRDINNFTTSSEISLINLENEPSEEIPMSPTGNSRTFVKEISTTIINAFTGKVISPNPWGKLCSKPVTHQIEADLIPIQLRSPKSTPQRRSNEKNPIRSSRRDDINHEDNPMFERDAHHQSIEIKHQENTPLQRRRKKRNSLKDSIDNTSTSSDEFAKEKSFDLHPKSTSRLVDSNASWYRLADVYTSDSSDENHQLFKSNASYSIRLKSDVRTSGLSPRSTVAETNPANVLNFLESLSERIPFEDKHSAAKPYFLPSGFDSKEKREELANQLLSIYNQDIFSSQLSDRVSVVWSGRLTATAGHCTSRRHTRTAVITLSVKVCNSPERCRDTLLHEACHAAVTLIDGVMEQGHGSLWKKWTGLVEKSYPYLPPISVRHTYDVLYKFIYKCVQCQYEVYRHSKSLNLAVDYCGKCLANFELIINDNKDNMVKPGRQTPKKTINKYNQYVKENFHRLKQANSHMSTPQLMKQLSEEYRKKNQQTDDIVLPQFYRLNI